MSHKFTITLHVELERSEGKFASRDDMEEALTEEIESADPGYLYGLGVNGESSYEVVSWEVVR